MTMFRFLAISAIASATLFVRLAVAQSVENNDVQSVATPTYQAGSLLPSILLYLSYIDGRWKANLTGDIKDPNTELIEVSLSNKPARVLTGSPPGGGRMCQTKMKDRSEFGYIQCNSAFYSVNAGASAAGTLIRGVLSLGILTAVDAASGNTAFTVSLDQAALDAAVSESKALDLAKASAPLIEYRQLYASAKTPQQLRNFIAKFENGFDPESLVAKAKEKIPAAIESEDKQQMADAARKAEARRQQEIRQRAEMEVVAAFRNKLQPGDRVILNIRSGPLLIGMAVEVKPPLVYVQWDNASPAMQWVRLESLTPPR